MEDSQKHETRVGEDEGPIVSKVGLRDDAVRCWPSTDGGSGGVTGPVGIGRSVVVVAVEYMVDDEH